MSLAALLIAPLVDVTLQFGELRHDRVDYRVVVVRSNFQFVPCDGGRSAEDRRIGERLGLGRSWSLISAAFQQSSHGLEFFGPNRLLLIEFFPLLVDRLGQLNGPAACFVQFPFEGFITLFQVVQIFDRGGLLARLFSFEELQLGGGQLATEAFNFFGQLGIHYRLMMALTQLLFEIRNALLIGRVTMSFLRRGLSLIQFSLQLFDLRIRLADSCVVGLNALQQTRVLFAQLEDILCGFIKLSPRLDQLVRAVFHLFA